MVPIRNVFIFALCLLLVSGTGAVFASAGANGYEITPETAIDTPDRTVTIEGETYTVDTTGDVRQGRDLTVTVETPGVDRYEVILYDSERRIVERTDKTEDGTVSFPTDKLTAGSYVVTVWVNGERKAVQPVVVSGYDIGVDAPEEVTAGSSFSVSATVSSVSSASEPPAHVTVVVFNDTWHEKYTATKNGDTYNADVSDSLSSGEYSVYVMTQNDNEVNGRNEVTGLSSLSSLTVTADDSATSTQSSDSSDGGGDGGDSTDATPTETPTSTTTSDGGETTTTTTDSAESVTTTTDASDSTPDTPTETPTSESPTEATQTTDDNVLDPSNTTDATTETTMPGFPVLLFVLLAVTGGLLQLRSAGRR